jgi:hypothetical protein
MLTSLIKLQIRVKELCDAIRAEEEYMNSLVCPTPEDYAKHKERGDARRLLYGLSHPKYLHFFGFVIYGDDPLCSRVLWTPRDK